jgi:hypothetical protein
MANGIPTVQDIQRNLLTAEGALAEAEHTEDPLRAQALAAVAQAAATLASAPPQLGVQVLRHR